MKLLLLSLFALSAHAQTTPTLEDLQRQINELKAQQAAAPAPGATDSKIKFFGDLRLRQQNEKAQPADERRRLRLQFRVGVKAEINDQLSVTGRLMTGTDANSGNVDMGAGSARKSIGLDQAYFNYQPVKQVQLQGGKMPSPFYFVGKNQLILDGDITLEGWAARVPYALNEQWTVTLAGASSWVRENYSSPNDISDSMLDAGQIFVTWKPGDTTLNLGGGHFAFSKLKGQPKTNYATLTTSTGNTLDGANAYAYNYYLNEYFAEVKQKWNDWEFGIFHEGIENTGAPRLNKATSTGLNVAYKKFTASFATQKIEKDGVFALYTHSDFAGNSTDSEGTMATIGYKLNPSTTLSVTQFANKRNISTTDTKYDRTQAELMMTF